MEVNLSRKSTLYNIKIFLVYSSVCERNGLTAGLCSNGLTAHFRGYGVKRKPAPALKIFSQI